MFKCCVIFPMVPFDGFLTIASAKGCRRTGSIFDNDNNDHYPSRLGLEKGPKCDESLEPLHGGNSAQRTLDPKTAALIGHATADERQARRFATPCGCAWTP